MSSLVFPNHDKIPGVLKMASGNVTVITRSPKTSKCKGNKRRVDLNDENIDSTAIVSSSSGKKKSKLTGTARRNERERNRVKQVNLGFAKLRDHVPKRGRGRKMSKVDILRSAADYIQQLQSMLDESDAVSAVMNIAVLSSSLGENGQLVDDGSDSSSCSESIGMLHDDPGSPSQYESALSPCCSVDGSTTSSTTSYQQSLMSSSQEYSPEEPTLMDLATWFH